MPQTDFKLLEKIESILQEDNSKLTAKEIAERIVKKYSNDCDLKYNNSKNPDKNKKSKIQFLIEQIGAEINAQRNKFSEINVVWIPEDRPAKFFYKEEIIDNIENTNDIKEIKLIGNKRKKEDLAEKDTYPLLIKYLYDQNIYAMRIDENKSEHLGKGQNKWLHPDVVGVESISNVRNWDTTIKNISNYYNINKTKIYSYEVKLSLNIGNVRECYFQVVSNSTWANCGYLVICEYPDNEVQDELEILSYLFGIGVIVLDKNRPTEKTKILIPAKEKENIDFNTLNRLLVNPDIKTFIDIIKEFYQVQEKISNIENRIKEEFRNKFNKSLN